MRTISISVKLFVVISLAMAFFAGMVGAIWLSLHSEEVKVPEIVGKDFYEGEKELEALGLKIKRRSYRYSKEKPNTILEQAPRPGETVKTGQTILVVVAQATPESTEAPAPVKKDKEEEYIFPPTEEEARKNINTNVKRPERTRDVIKKKNTNLADTAVKPVINQSADKVESKKEDKIEDKNPEAKPKTTVTPVKTPPIVPGDIRNRRIIP